MSVLASLMGFRRMTSQESLSGSLESSRQRAVLLWRELQKRQRSNRLSFYRPFPKQREFHDAGAVHRERLFMAGNQLGKTLAGAMEMAMHLTGRYPDWWSGRRVSRAGRYWAAGATRVSTRDTVQKLLVGPPERSEEWGTGAIPAECLGTPTPLAGVPNAIDSVTVRHVSGYLSTLLFKAYEQGREKWQGDTLDGVWFDEEPPMSIYTEGLTRTNATEGFVMVTFTPLLGMSEVVRMFLGDADIEAMR